MKGEDLYQAMEHIDDQVLERSQRRERPCRGQR